MLESIFILFNVLAFLFMVLAFIPINKEGQSRDAEESYFDVETRSTIPVFSFLAFGLLMLVALMSVYIEIPFCAAAIKSITVNGNISNYTYVGTSGNFTSSVMSCSYLTYKDGWPLAYLYGGLGMMMLAYAILSSLITGFGTLVSTFSRAR